MVIRSRRPQGFRPAYRSLSRAKLQERVERAVASLAQCRACPRDCGVDRLADKWAACKTGRHAIVGSWFPHFGEEDCLRGWNGSGTIFFSHCNLRCQFCFHPDTLVSTDRGLLRIEDLFWRGEASQQETVRFINGSVRILTRKGRLAGVTKVFRHSFSGGLLRVKPYNCPPILVTPEHELFVTTRESAGHVFKVRADRLSRNHRLIVPERRAVGSSVVLDVSRILVSGSDFMKAIPRRVSRAALVSAFAANRTSDDIGTLLGYHPAYVRKLRGEWRRDALPSSLFQREVQNTLVEQAGGRIKFKSEKRSGIPARITLDSRLAWLLGFYCAEGHISSARNRPNSHHLVFSLAHSEVERARHVRDLIEELFGLRFRLVNRRTTVTVELHKASIAQFFASMCGHSAHRKRVPSVLFRAETGVLEAFLEGFLVGDGCDRGTHRVINTVSNNLAYGLFQVGLFLGMLPSFHEWHPPPTKLIEGRRVRQKPLYYVKFPKLDLRSGERHSRWTPKNGAYHLPIHKIERIPYDGPVYNLEVDDPDHSYLAPFVAVGNCQNYDISQAIKPKEAPPGSRPEEIAAMMLELQGRGCHNINFVTPEHVVPQVLEAVLVAIDRGLDLPIVYNTSAYDALESIALMDGVIDIYMPDFKFWSAERSRTYMMAEDYPEAARAAIRAMHAQVGPLVIGADGLARRGLILRHLVMPGMLDETRGILEWVATELGPGTYVNLMDQYYPAGRVGPDRLPEINRRVTSAEFLEAQEIARELGLRHLDERHPHPLLRRRLGIAV